jgi:hypothetical protein
MSVFSDAEREYLGSQRFGRLAAVGPDGTPRGAHRLPLQPPARAGWGATEGKSANRSGSRQELSGTGRRAFTQMEQRRRHYTAVSCGRRAWTLP